MEMWRWKKVKLNQNAQNNLYSKINTIEKKVNAYLGIKFFMCLHGSRLLGKLLLGGASMGMI